MIRAFKTDAWFDFDVKYQFIKQQLQKRVFLPRLQKKQVVARPSFLQKVRSEQQMAMLSPPPLVFSKKGGSRTLNHKHNVSIIPRPDG